MIFVGQPFEPDPDSAGVGKRESLCHSGRFSTGEKGELKTVFPGHAQVVMSGTVFLLR